HDDRLDPGVLRGRHSRGDVLPERICEGDEGGGSPRVWVRGAGEQQQSPTRARLSLDDLTPSHGRGTVADEAEDDFRRSDEEPLIFIARPPPCKRIRGTVDLGLRPE